MVSFEDGREAGSGIDRMRDLVRRGGGGFFFVGMTLAAAFSSEGLLAATAGRVGTCRWTDCVAAGRSEGVTEAGGGGEEVVLGCFVSEVEEEGPPTGVGGTGVLLATVAGCVRGGSAKTPESRPNACSPTLLMVGSGFFSGLPSLSLSLSETLRVSRTRLEDILAFDG